MRKTILVIILSFLCFTSLSKAESDNDNNTMREQLKKNKYSSIVGYYCLFNFKVKISTNKDNKLLLTMPIISKQTEELSEGVSNLNQSLPEEFPNGIFPHHGSYELIPISNSIFIIKYSGGLSIELKKLNSGFEKELVLHDSDFDVMGYSSFYKILFSHKNVLSIAENIEYKQLKNKLQEMRLNMHKLQISLETYFIDFQGFYPYDLSYLIEEAKDKGYWKEIINPFTKKSEIGKEGSLIYLKDYKKLTISPPGLVVYEAIDCNCDKNMKTSKCKSYKIYGTDEKGKLIKDKDSTFYLSNQ